MFSRFLAMAFFALLSTCALPPSSYACDPGNTLDDAVALFSQPGDSATLLPVIDPDGVAGLVSMLGGSDEQAAQARDTGAYLFIGHNADAPGAIVSIGLFDDERCFTGGSSNVPIDAVAAFAPAFGPPENISVAY